MWAVGEFSILLRKCVWIMQVWMSLKIGPFPDYWRLLLKLYKQIGGTIYWQFLAANEAKGLEGVYYICLIGCKIPPVGGYVTVCQVFTLEVYVRTQCPK